MADWKDVAEKLFPHIHESIGDLDKKYPQRSETVVSRFAPSPTGFLHIGGLFSAFVSWKFVQQNNGKFILRIEDTDQKRFVDNAIDHILSSLRTFDLSMHEGPLGVEYADIGNYGPYIQSHRRHLYHVFVKHLIAEGKAYPCWMKPEELTAIREQQMKSKIQPGIYGNYSIWRNKSPDDILDVLNQEDIVSLGDKKDRNFVIRLRSHGNVTTRIMFEDVLRGKISMNDNYNDTVILKSGGLPTYHMAHIVDDYLMRVTHIIRAEEWLMSVPLHLQLFEACGLIAPQYCHLFQLLKVDEETGKKRKLSKRKDPEADIGFFFKEGFAIQGILEYLMILMHSRFEEWQAENVDKDYKSFEITLEKMNKSGALFDLEKLNSVNNAYLSRISHEELYYQTLEWAKMYSPEFAVLMEGEPKYTIAALSIERHTEKDPKRFTRFLDVKSQLLFFYDKEWEKLHLELKSKIDNGDEEFNLPDSLSSDLLKKIIPEYLEILDFDMETQDWFNQLKEFGKEHGFAGNNKEFKEGGYVGKVGELAMFFRLALCSAKRTPDLFSVMKVLGMKRVKERLEMMLEII